MAGIRKTLAGIVAAALVAGVPLGAGAANGAARAEAPPGHTTAWRDGALQVDTAGVVSRSDLVLVDAPWRPEQSMPLGNGTLGAAVWDHDGFTAMLQRNDTFPNLRSAGELLVPGLYRLASADDYRGRLALHDAELRQSGNSMTATTYVRADRDQMVLEVTGAPAGQTQTADLTLGNGRTPTTFAGHGIATLAQQGQLAALTADARQVQASVVDDHTVRLSFTPRADGTFRLALGVPTYDGGDLEAASIAAVQGYDASNVEQSHLRWWHHFWAGANPLEINSPDGTGEYMEALRAQQLYTEASAMRNTLPSGQAGAVDLFYPWQDAATSASTWFHFNLRQDVFANYGAGTADLNASYLRLYTQHLQQIEAYTRQHWSGSKGACVPELISYDGTPSACLSEGDPAWTQRILTGGLEVSHDIWQTYRYTGDASYLEQGYPLMKDVAEFYLWKLESGDDGKLHLNHVNSFETQWDTTDPTTDIAGMRVMFPIVANLADQRGDTDLARQLRTAVTKLPDIPTTTRDGKDVVAWSTTDEPAKNTQNTDMEPLYPWGLLGAGSQLMQTTYDERVFPQTREWNEDPIWAARLHRPAELARTLVYGTENLQKYPNGYTTHGTNDDPAKSHSVYSEWGGIVAGALQEALVQTSPSGALEIGAAWPSAWGVAGTVSVAGGHKISTQMSEGTPDYVGIEAGSDDTVKVANPWPGQVVDVVAGSGKGAPVVEPTTADVVSVPVREGRSYLLQRVGRPVGTLPFAPVAGSPAQEAHRLGTRTLGIAGGTAQITSGVVSQVSPATHTLVRADVGTPLYVDTSDWISSLPSDLTGSAMIEGISTDAKVTSPTDYLTMNLSRAAPVYVAMDARGRGTWWPSWLQTQGYHETGETVGVRQYAPSFQIVDGRLRASGGGVTLSKQGVDWGDQVITATVSQVQVGSAVVFRAPDSQNGYVWQIGGPLGGPSGLSGLRMSTLVNGKSTLLGTVPLKPGAQNTYRLRIETIGDEIKTYVNGALVDDRHDSTFSHGRVGFSMGGSDIGEFDDVSVSTPAGQRLFFDDFSGDLSQWDVPADRQNVPLVVFEKDMPAGPVVLGPPSGNGSGNAPYVAFVGDQAASAR